MDQPPDQHSMSQSPPKNNPLMIIGIVTVLLLLTGITSFYLGRRTSNPAPVVHNDYVSPSLVPTEPNISLSSTDETANWKTYTDLTDNFSVKYPLSIYPNQCGGPIFSDKPINDCGSERVWLLSIGKSNGSILNYLNGYKDYYNFIKVAPINGNETYKVILKQNVNNAPGLYNEGYTSFVSAGGSFFVIKLTNNDFLDVYTKMISTFTFSEKASSTDTNGMIEGTLIYPSEALPDQKVCAEDISTNKTYCTEVNIYDKRFKSGKGYSLELPTGSYYIYATILNNPNSRKAYYDEFVTCGLNASCSSTKKIEVKVVAGKTVTGIDPNDWYN